MGTAFEHVTRGARLQGLEKAGLLTEHRKDQQFGIRTGSRELTQQILTSSVGQAEVDQEHIGTTDWRHLKRLNHAARVSNQLPTRTSIQGLRHKGQDGGIVFNQVDACFNVHVGSRRTTYTDGTQRAERLRRHGRDPGHPAPVP